RPGDVPNDRLANHRGTDITHRGNPPKSQIVRPPRRSHPEIRDTLAETFSRVLHPTQLRTLRRKRRRHSAQSQEILQAVCGWWLPANLPSLASLLSSKIQAASLKAPSGFPRFTISRQ